MATIGTFTSNGNGFTGTVRTLALNAKAKLVRVENPSDKGPHFRIFAGNVELGAAWQKTAKDTPPDGVPQGVVEWDVEVTNQHAEPVAVYSILTLVRRLG